MGDEAQNHEGIQISNSFSHPLPREVMEWFIIFEGEEEHNLIPSVSFSSLQIAIAFPIIQLFIPFNKSFIIYTLCFASILFSLLAAGLLAFVCWQRTFPVPFASIFILIVSFCNVVIILIVSFDVDYYVHFNFISYSQLQYCVLCECDIVVTIFCDLPLPGCQRIDPRPECCIVYCGII